MSGQPTIRFGDLLRRLRTDAGLTQEDLAEAAGISVRSVSDLERGVNQTSRKDTARRLADALNLVGAARVGFEAAARGHSRQAEAPPADSGTLARSIVAIPNTLPPSIRFFTGREAELATLMSAVTEGSGPGGGTVEVHAIDGMAGVGKSAFALHAAHKLVKLFPDGQFFLRLHAHTAGQRPVEPGDALASLLLAAKIPAKQIPPGVVEREGMWREHLAGKQVLLLLDDAAGHEQVRPLLPGTPGSLVLITSRHHLAALDEATSICLGTLPPDEAATLLVQLAKPKDVREEDPSVAELNRLCGFLPLAISMLARQLHHHPTWTVAELASRLAASRDRLKLMHAENLSVAAAFDLSYQDLTDDQQRLFVRLGLYPGTDIDAYAAAALNNTDISASSLSLGKLFDHHLISEPIRGRYRMHELIREHARSLALTGDQAELEEAVTSVFHYYLYCSVAANRLIAPHTMTSQPEIKRPKNEIPTLVTATQAMDWLKTERSNLLACADFAVARGWSGYVIRLAAELNTFLRTSGYLDDALTLHQAAADIASKTGSETDEAIALTNLGAVQCLTGRHEAATVNLTKALNIQTSLDDRLGQAEALNYLGLVKAMKDDYQAATMALEEALALYRQLGDSLGQAHAMTRLGIVQRLTGDYPSATNSLKTALELYQSRPETKGEEAEALVGLGVVQRLAVDYSTAVATLAEALDIYQDSNDLVGQAEALNELGLIQRLTGDYASAMKSHELALKLSRSQRARPREADALRYLGSARQEFGDYPAVMSDYLAALALYRELGDRLGEAHALNYLGVLHRLTYNLAESRNTLKKAFDLYLSLGHRLGQAEVLNNLGDTYAMNSLDEARCNYDQALTIAKEINAWLEVGHALEGLGECEIRDSNINEGTEFLRQARDIYLQIGSSRASRIEERLASDIRKVLPRRTVDPCNRQPESRSWACVSTWPRIV